MGAAREIALILRRDGYNISTRNATIMALQEDLNYPEEEAINIADEVIRASREI